MKKQHQKVIEGSYHSPKPKKEHDAYFNYHGCLFSLTLFLNSMLSLQIHNQRVAIYLDIQMSVIIALKIVYS